jgi:hypothetical protein
VPFLSGKIGRSKLKNSPDREIAMCLRGSPLGSIEISLSKKGKLKTKCDLPSFILDARAKSPSASAFTLIA